MVRVFFVCVVGFLAATVSYASAIVDGTPTSLSKYPFFSAVGTGCGGALIKPDRVLTAAHCSEVLNESEAIRVGPDRILRKVKLRATLPLHIRELAKIEREFPPPAGDLMVLKLNKPVRGVPLARIATPQEGLTAIGTSATTIGRGATRGDGTGQGVFRSGTVQIQDASHCEDELASALLRAWSLCTRDPRMFDPADKGPFVSACFGDSGGPLLASTAGGERIVGVVSWGPSCGEERDPEIYANAVKGRNFALAAKPAWAPKAIGRPKVVGPTVVGKTVTCRVKWLQKPTRNLTYGFYVDGFQVQSGRKATHRLRPSSRGKKISCDGQGATAGGRGGSLSLAPYRLVR